MEGVEQQLEDLAGGGSLGTLAEAAAEVGEGGVDDGAEGGDLVAELSKWGAHASDGGVDVDKAGAEADEVRIIAVDEVDKLRLKGG